MGPGRFGGRNGRLPLAVFGVLTLAGAVVLDAIRPAGRGLLVVTRDNPDSLAYFANAHSLLFDRDLDLTNQYARLLPGARLSAAAIRHASPVPATGRPGSPYALGYSLLGLVPLALGSAFDALVGGAADGWGPWAERFFAAANLLWLVIGLGCLRAWLERLAVAWGAPAEGRPWPLVAALALVPATALGYYALTVMSHTASFLAVALFLFLADRYRDSDRARDWAAVGAAGGLVVLCRWPDALLLLVPVFDELVRAGRRARWRRPGWWRSRLVALAAALAVFAPQVAQWRYVYGRAWLVPQGDDFLEWPPRHVADVLFSSWNGLFFTTPATIAGIAGLLLAARRTPRLALPPLAAWAALVVAIGAQTGNWNGHAFAQRHLIAALPVVAAGWLWLLLRGRPARLALAAVLVAGAAFTFASSIQWRYALAPRLDRLTVEEAFGDKLRLDRAFARERAVRAALDLEDPAARHAALEEAERRHGVSRSLLRELTLAARLAGDEAGARTYEARLAAWLARRLP